MTDKPTDWRALCAELVDGWVEGCDIAGPMARTRTALAQLVPEGLRPDRYELGDAILRSWLKHGQDSWCSIADDVLAELPGLAQPEPEVSQLSDGYHTFAELYQHRHSLCLALMKALPGCSWFSRRHADGEKCFGGDDWFIIGIDPPGGQTITYHLPIELYPVAQSTGAAELQRGRPWDGHTAVDVVIRLRDWAALAQPEPEGVTDEELKLMAAEWSCRTGLDFARCNYARVDFARAALARWGRPTIKPVPVAERLPEAEDCFSGQHGQRSYKCWAQQYHTDNDGQPLRTVLEAWDLVDYRLLARCRRWYYAWVPHHALPLPQP